MELCGAREATFLNLSFFTNNLRVFCGEPIKSMCENTYIISGIHWFIIIWVVTLRYLCYESFKCIWAEINQLFECKGTKKSL